MAGLFTALPAQRRCAAPQENRNGTKSRRSGSTVSARSIGGTGALRAFMPLAHAAADADQSDWMRLDIELVGVDHVRPRVSVRSRCRARNGAAGRDDCRPTSLPRAPRRDNARHRAFRRSAPACAPPPRSASCTFHSGHVPAEARELEACRRMALDDVAGAVEAHEVERHPLGVGLLQRREAMAHLLEARAEHRSTAARHRSACAAPPRESAHRASARRRRNNWPARGG